MQQQSDWHPWLKTLHWLMAVMLLLMIFVGWAATQWPETPFKLKLYVFHKSLGLTLLGLVVLRLVLRWRLGAAASPSAMPLWQRRIATLAHSALYLLVLALPLSGWLLNSAANFPLNWFGLWDVPALTVPNDSLKALMQQWHYILSVVFSVLLGVHVLAALQHHYLKNDAVLRRMLPANMYSKVLLAIGLVAAVLGGALLLLSALNGSSHDAQQTPSKVISKQTAVTSSSAATGWLVVEPASQLGFVASYDDVEFNGHFQKFIANIEFDPDSLATSYMHIIVDTASVTTQNTERDNALAGGEWFDFGQFPQAEFKTIAIQRVAANNYTADAILTIKGIQQSIVFDFTWEKINGAHVLQATTLLNRLKFDIGSGMWVDPIVGHTVTVITNLQLRKK